MNREKSFILIIDETPTANIPIYYNNTVEELKTYLNSLYPTKQLENIYITPTTMLPNDDKIIIGSYWSQITQGYLVLKTKVNHNYYINNISYFEKLPKDVLYQMFLNTSHQDILNLCLTSKQFNDILCNSSKFWSLKLYHDYKISANEIGGEYNAKDMYPYVKYLNDPDGGMFAASAGGNKGAIDFFISKGARKYLIPIAMRYAAENGHEEIFNYLSTLFSMDHFLYKSTVFSAIKGGNKNIISSAMKLANYGMDDMFKDIDTAVNHNNMKVIKYISNMKEGKLRQKILNYGLLSSSRDEYVDGIEYFITEGATNLSESKKYIRDHEIKDFFSDLVRYGKRY